jgi:chromate transporter
MTNATPAQGGSGLGGPSLPSVLREWGRIGCTGFGGPPTHIALLRDLCVERRRWLNASEFEEAVAACNLLPGPASTQLAIFCAWRVRGWLAAVVGGAAFIVPGLILMLALAALFLAGSPPAWVRGAGAGAGAAVAAVAVQAGAGLVPASWRRAQRISRFRWPAYLAAGAAAAATVGPWLVLVLIGCGLAELVVSLVRRRGQGEKGASSPDTETSPGTGTRAITVAPAAMLAAAGIGGGVLLSVAWVAFKVGALSYGGGFVIVPLMQADAVAHYHWMTGGQFLNAVALGQITPGPVVQTVAAVGYAAAGIGGGLLAAAVAFAPSFAFVLIGGRHFDRLRTDDRARAFLGGAGPAAIGAIFGSAIPLALALTQAWQYAVLACAAAALLLLRRGVVLTLLFAAAAGMIVALAGGPLPH